MEGFKSGIYIISKKEKKSRNTLSQSSFTQLRLFSQQSGAQARQKQKQSKKVNHTVATTSQEQPRKQMKSALHQEEALEFNPSDQISMEQLIKVVLNLQEEIKKLKKDNKKLMQQLNLAEGIEPRLMSQKRELSAFWNISQNQNSQSQNQLQKQTKLDNILEKQKRNCNDKQSKISNKVIVIQW